MDLTSTLLTTKDLSGLINVKEGTIRHLCFKREIPFIKIGKLVRFEKQEVLKWLNEHKEKTKKEFCKN